MVSNNDNGFQSTVAKLKRIQNFKNKLREFYSFRKFALLNLMREVEEMNLMQPFFSPIDRLILGEF